MKKILSAGLILCISILKLNAQWQTNGNNISNTNSGNVGIGTTSPMVRLDLGTTTGQKFGLYNSGNTRIGLGVDMQSGLYGLSLYTNNDIVFGQVSTSDGSTFTSRMTIQNGGKVGIGTTNPGTKLDVNGTASFGQTYQNVLKVGPLDHSTGYFYINTKIPFNDFPAPQLHITGYNYAHSNKAVNLTLSWYVYNNTFYWSQYKSDLGYYNPTRIRLGTYSDEGTTRIRIEIANDGTYWSSYFVSATDHNGSSSYYDGWSYSPGTMPGETGNLTVVSEFSGIIYNNAGNVLIGKNTQSNGTYKLDVLGKIRANEVVVNTTGADFVFAPEYKLPTLPEVESFIKANKHLPDLASAAEMKENGMNVSEIQTKLLQKIEEMTLYIIQQNKEIEELKQVVRIQKKEYKNRICIEK